MSTLILRSKLQTFFDIYTFYEKVIEKCGGKGVSRKGRWVGVGMMGFEGGRYKERSGFGDFF